MHLFLIHAVQVVWSGLEKGVRQYNDIRFPSLQCLVSDVSEDDLITELDQTNPVL